MIPDEEERPMMRRFLQTTLALLLLAGALWALPLPAEGQAAPGSGLGRPYWHVFAAYVVAWALVLGWVVSIARRLARIEKRLED